MVEAEVKCKAGNSQTITEEDVSLSSMQVEAKQKLENIINLNNDINMQNPDMMNHSSQFQTVKVNKLDFKKPENAEITLDGEESGKK
ncbi:hypothetical protein JTB14_021105 [Gonioctena quinquepunctata]|nr:hypothetical protein JTB14_021105 [Gonioctena quinquepunctata]